MPPIDRIFNALLVIFGLLFVCGFLLLGNAWGVMLVALAATIGPFMGIDYPFPVPFKIAYVTALLLSVAAMIYGVKARRYKRGQAAAVFGVLLWPFLGMMGLGTGT